MAETHKDLLLFVEGLRAEFGASALSVAEGQLKLASGLALIPWRNIVEALKQAEDVGRMSSAASQAASVALPDESSASA